MPQSTSDLLRYSESRPGLWDCMVRVSLWQTTELWYVF